MDVSNPIGTKFKSIHDDKTAMNSMGFKSHRDKVQMSISIANLKHNGVSNPIGTKFK